LRADCRCLQAIERPARQAARVQLHEGHGGPRISQGSDSRTTNPSTSLELTRWAVTGNMSAAVAAETRRHGIQIRVSGVPHSPNASVRTHCAERNRARSHAGRTRAAGCVVAHGPEFWRLSVAELTAVPFAAHSSEHCAAVALAQSAIAQRSRKICLLLLTSPRPRLHNAAQCAMRFPGANARPSVRGAVR
jgi:hypothetical protein